VQREKEHLPRAIAKQVSMVRASEGMIKEAFKELNVDPESLLKWSEDDVHALAQFIRRKTKPMIIAANKMDLHIASENLARCKEQFPDYMFVPMSAESELALKEAAKAELIEYVPGESKFTPTEKLNEKQKHALDFIQKNVLDVLGSTGAQQVINEAVFTLLKRIAVFPGGANKLGDKHGNILPDCFLLPPKATALDFAAHIHTDLAKNFIAAIDCKTKRRLGKDHPLNHRDVVEILVKK